MIELWPFTNFHDMNLDWIIRTVKTYTKKVDDFIADITEAWDNFKDWTTGQIDQMHDDFANYVNVTEGALNTGAIADGAITESKINAAFLKTIKNIYVTVEEFGGVGDGVTDDTLAFQAAINSGKVIMLAAEKTYYVSDRLMIGEDGMVLIGNGATIYVEPKTTISWLFYAEHSNKVIIDDLKCFSTNQYPTVPSPDHTIVAESTSSNTYFIEVRGCAYTYLNNIHTENMYAFFATWKDTLTEVNNDKIIINNVTTKGSCRSDMYLSHSKNVTINNYQVSPSSTPIEGEHIFYTAEQMETLNISNVVVYGSEHVTGVFSIGGHEDVAVDITANNIVSYDCLYHVYLGKYTGTAKLENCKFIGGKVLFRSQLDPQGTPGWFTFSNCRFYSETSGAAIIETVVDSHAKVAFENCEFEFTDASRMTLGNYLPAKTKFVGCHVKWNGWRFVHGVTVTDLLIKDCVFEQSQSGALVVIPTLNGDFKLEHNIIDAVGGYVQVQAPGGLACFNTFTTSSTTSGIFSNTVSNVYNVHNGAAV